MWMNQPANRLHEDDTSDPDHYVIKEWMISSFVSVENLPAPSNDPGFPPKGVGHDCTVLLVCTGTDGEELSLDVVLRTPKGEQTIAVKVPERDAIAEARHIGALYGAPLAMLSLTGHLVQLEPASPPAPHRYGSSLSGRRPRFLARRQTGLMPVPLVAAEPVSERKSDGHGEWSQKGAGSETGSQQETGVAIRAK